MGAAHRALGGGQEAQGLAVGVDPRDLQALCFGRVQHERAVALQAGGRRVVVEAVDDGHCDRLAGPRVRKEPRGALRAEEGRHVRGGDAVGDVLRHAARHAVRVGLQPEVVVVGVARGARVDVGVRVAVLGDGCLAIGRIDEHVVWQALRLRVVG